MNEPNRFFRVLNHVISFLILFVLVTIVGLGLWSFIAKAQWKTMNEAGVGLGNIEQIHGLPIQILSIRGKGGKFSSGGYNDILFLSKDFKEAHRLFPNGNVIIIDFTQFPEKDGINQIAKAIFYKVINQDSDGDGKLSYDDRTIIALSKPDGTGYVEIVSDAQRIIEYKSVNQDTDLAVLFERNGKFFYQTFSLETFLKTSDIEIPITP